MAENKKSGSGKPKTSMFALVQAGKAEAEKVQNIKSVAPTNTPAISEVVEPVPEPEQAKVIAEVKPEPEQVNEISPEEVSEPVKAAAKGLAMLFKKTEIKETEAVKIPRQFHRELKVLSSMSGVSMIQMLSNLIESFLEDNQKEILSYRKKYINGSYKR